MLERYFFHAMTVLVGFVGILSALLGENDWAVMCVGTLLCLWGWYVETRISAVRAKRIKDLEGYLYIRTPK